MSLRDWLLPTETEPLSMLLSRGLLVFAIGLTAFALSPSGRHDHGDPAPHGKLPVPDPSVRAVLAWLALLTWAGFHDYDFTERLLNGLAVFLSVWFALAAWAKLRGRIRREHWFHDWSWSGFSAVWLALIIRATLVEAYSIPSESMVPTLLISDHLFVGKTAFGWHIPFTHGRVLKFRDVKRGEIVIFVPPSAPKQSYVKRCVGLPGDTVEVRQKMVYINGQPAELQTSFGRLDVQAGLPDDARASLVEATQRYLAKRLPELKQMSAASAQLAAQQTTWLGPLTVPEGTYYVEAAAVGQRFYGRLADAPKVGHFELWPKDFHTPPSIPDWSRDHGLGNRDNFGPYKLQPGEYWMMGDNRDNSSDSRYFGPVPEENLRGTPLIRYWPVRAGRTSSTRSRSPTRDRAS